MLIQDVACESRHVAVHHGQLALVHAQVVRRVHLDAAAGRHEVGSHELDHARVLDGCMHEELGLDGGELLTARVVLRRGRERRTQEEGE